MITWHLDVLSAEQLGVFVGRYRLNPERRLLVLEAAKQLADKRHRETMEHLMNYRGQGPLPDPIHEMLRCYEQHIPQTLTLNPLDIRCGYTAIFGAHDLKETEQR